MSYEGYEQNICKNGHYFESDCYDHEPICYACGAEMVWFNSVDQTNGPNQGEIPYEILKEKFLKESAKTETCPHCNHTKTNSPDIFRIPTKEETDQYRVHFDEE